MSIPRRTFGELKLGDYFLFDYGMYIKTGDYESFRVDGYPLGRPTLESAVRKLDVRMTYEVV